MSVIKPSILDRVKAKLQAVFARHQPANVPARSETSTTNTAAPETGAAQGRETPTGAKDVGSDLSLPWLTDTQREILHQMERGTTTERRLIDRARILSNVETLRSKKGVARTLGIDIKTVRTWHARWDEVRGVLSPTSWPWRVKNWTTRMDLSAIGQPINWRRWRWNARLSSPFRAPVWAGFWEKPRSSHT